MLEQKCKCENVLFISICLLHSRCWCYPYYNGDDCSQCSVTGSSCVACAPCVHGFCVQPQGNMSSIYIIHKFKSPQIVPFNPSLPPCMMVYHIHTLLNWSILECEPMYDIYYYTTIAFHLWITLKKASQQSPKTWSTGYAQYVLSFLTIAYHGTQID